MSGPGEQESIYELVSPIKPYIRGVCALIHDADSFDEGAKYILGVNNELEAGNVIFGGDHGPIGHRCSRVLYETKIPDKSYVIVIKTIKIDLKEIFNKLELISSFLEKDIDYFKSENILFFKFEEDIQFSYAPNKLDLYSLTRILRIGVVDDQFSELYSFSYDSESQFNLRRLKFIEEHPIPYDGIPWFDKNAKNHTPFKIFDKMATCGIYLIKNKLNGREYFGSAFDIFGRLSDHKRDLKNNDHVNYKLQNDYNKFGLENFIFIPVLSLINSPFLLRKIENQYINYYNSYYNILREETPLVFPTRKSIYNGKIEVFIGEKSIIPENLTLFCYQNNLNLANLLKVAKGIISNHKGVKCRFVGEADFRFKKKKRKPKENCVKYFITGLDGKEFPVDNLHQFAINNGLSYSSLLHCAAGKSKTCKGLMVRYADQEYKYIDKRSNCSAKTWELVSPSGENLIITNLEKFCIINEIKYDYFFHKIKRSGECNGYKLIKSYR
jgi:hypothetical protein